jgi:hypothetical protein
MTALLPSQDLFKCLRYPTKYALSQADLDDNQKIELFNQDEESIENTRVFFVPLNPDIADTARSELRIFVRSFDPNNDHLVGLEVSIQVICSNSICRLDEGRQRHLVMVHEILNQLNGTDIGFVGLVKFEKPIRIIQYNKLFIGYEMIATTRST